MPSVFRRIKYKTGNVARLLSSPFYQISICPGEATSIFGCSFGKNGWHHIKTTLDEFDADPAISYNNTSLYAFLTKFVPETISDVFPALGNFDLPLFVYPWDMFGGGMSREGKDRWNSRFCGPSTESFVRDEFDRILSLYKDLQRVGYQPDVYPNSFISGLLLKRTNGEKRFIVTQGNHRLAILSHLSNMPIQVRMHSRSSSIVLEKNLSRWPLVRKRVIKEERALELFHSFFKFNGYHIRNRLPTDPL